MNRPLPRLILLGLIGVIALSMTACTRQARAERHITAANKLFTAGRYDEAEIEYKSVLQLRGDSPVPYTRLGTIYLEDGRIGQALVYLKRAKELQPNEVETRLKFGLAMLGVGQLTVAREEAVFVLQHRPADDDAIMLLAEASVNSKDIAAARAQLEALPAAVAGRASVALARGQMEIRSGHIAEAERYFQQALTLDPKSAHALAALATLALARKDLNAADAGFKAAAENSGPRSPHRIQYAQFKAQTGDVPTARRLLEESTKSIPDYLPAWLGLGEIALTEKKFDEAERCARTALNRDSIYPDAIMLSARIRLARNEPDQAATMLEGMVGRFPQAPMAQYLLGIAYATKGDRTKAREALQRATTLAPDFAPAVLALAELNLRSGDFAAATSLLAPLAQKQPNTLSVALMLAQAYRGQGNLEGALGVLQKAESQSPNNAQIIFFRGTILRQQGKLVDARTAFENAAKLTKESGPLEQLVELDLLAKDFASARRHAEAAIAAAPTSGTAYMALARVFVASNQYAEAIANFQQAIVKAPKNLEALTTLAVLQDMQKDYAGARDSYERLLAVAPNSNIALNNLAYIYAEHFNDLDKALDLARRARSIFPDEPQAGDTLGWILYRKGEFQQALNILRDSGAKLPDNTEVQYHLGLASYMMGREGEAQSALSKAIQSPTSFTGRVAAQQALSILAVDVRNPDSTGRALVEKFATEHPRDPAALVRISTWSLREGNLAKARQAADAAVQANPKNVPAMLQLAQVYVAQNNPKKALELAKDARALAPNETSVTYLLGRLAYDARDFRWSASLLQEAADRSPDDADIQFDWSQAAYSVGQLEPATDAATAALKINNSFGRAAQAREFLELTQAPSTPTDSNKLAQAEKVLQRDPNSVPALMVKGAASEARHDLKTARSFYEKALQIVPEFPPAQRALLIVYGTLDEKIANAADLGTKARQAYPSDPAVAKAYGIVLYRDGDFARATSLFQQSASANPTDGEAQFYLGMSQFQLKKSSDSKRSLQRALELGLNDDMAAKARKSLSSIN